jgi:hypothetical protein
MIDTDDRNLRRFGKRKKDGDSEREREECMRHEHL